MDRLVQVSIDFNIIFLFSVISSQILCEILLLVTALSVSAQQQWLTDAERARCVVVKGGQA